MPNQFFSGNPNPNVLGTFSNKNYLNGPETAGGVGAIFRAVGTVQEAGQTCANPFSQLVEFEVFQADGTAVDPEGDWNWSIDVELRPYKTLPPT